MTDQAGALRLPDFETWMAASPQPVAVLRGSDHAVLAANAAFETLVGVPRAALLGRAEASDALWPQPQQRRQLWAALEQGSAAGRFAITLRGCGGVPQTLAAAAHRVHADGEAQVVLLLSAPPDAPPVRSPGADGKLLQARGSNLDVTEDRRREQRLRLSEAIIENMSESVMLCSRASGLILYASPRYEAMLGYAPGELLGRHAADVNSPAEADPLETGRRIEADLRRAGVWSGTVRNRRKDGQDIWVRASITTFDHDEHGPVWLNVHADVTEERLAQQARDQVATDLQRLAASVQETIEAERAALSRDLHDQLGAALAGIRMRLETVAAGLPGASEGPRAELLAIAAMAQDAAVQTRDICSRLRPPTLDDLGIV